MHRYFLIPFIGFFLIISIIMIYLQFVNEDWKFLVPKIKLPDSCNNNNQVEFVIHESDINQNRSFKDEKMIFPNIIALFIYSIAILISFLFTDYSYLILSFLIVNSLVLLPFSVVYIIDSFNKKTWE